ncbi:MAG: hypothetical protein JW959_04245 [Pirellulales bacterium]|nr:hypothetical protein [Pirellulales bacterium]
MSHTRSFTDIHCHLLPGLDDGASDAKEALAMAEMAVNDGIETIIATPHQLGNYAKNSGRTVRAAVAEFQNLLDGHRVPLRVLPGAEVRIEPGLLDKIRSGEVVTLGDRRRHVLLELPHDVYFPIDRLLDDLASAGLTGILAHPERNRGIINQPAVLRPLVEHGCLLQVTAGSLTGDFGAQVQKIAESIVSQGLAHVVATDAHGTKKRPPVMSRAFWKVSKLVGEKNAFDLCSCQPKVVAAGGAVSSGRRAPVKLSRFGWLRRTFSSEYETARPI